MHAPDASADSFDLAYTEGILDPLPEETPAVEAGRALPPGTSGAATSDEMGFTRAMPTEAIALKGCVLTPARRIDDGYVVIDGPEIAEVRDTPPDPSVRVLDTDSVILPGLIDLHGHPEYNIFAAWEPPKLFANRNIWRRSKEYEAIVKKPWRELTEGATSIREVLVRYAEARALVGGATAIQGANRTYVKKEESLVRNVDLRVFGRQKARSIVDLDRVDEPTRIRLRAAIADGDVTAVYVHLAEGVDDTSRREFDALVEAELLTPATVIIHGTALTPAQLGDVKDAGAKLVWSPQSNLRLYGATTDAATALSIGLPLGLGADWLPSGSPSLLGEIKVARRSLRQQGRDIEPEALVRMVTAGAADIAGLGDLLGRLEPGRPADVLVLERNQEDPWENVVQADPSWINLVAIGGNLVYGRRDWIAGLTPPSPTEDALAWGKEVTVDTSYSVSTTAADPPRLAQLRAELLDRFPQAGPIFA